MKNGSGGTDTSAVFIPPLQGSRLWVTDALITFVATGEHTGAKYSLTDSVVPPGGGPPPHMHHREDEAFWILEGELEISAGEETFPARAGSFVHLPRGVLHSYPVDEEPGRCSRPPLNMRRFAIPKPNGRAGPI